MTAAGHRATTAAIVDQIAKRRAVHTREVVRDVRPEQLAGLIDKVEAQGREIERLQSVLRALAQEIQK